MTSAGQETTPMCAMRQLDQQENIGNTGNRLPSGPAQPCGVGRRPESGEGHDKASAKIADHERSSKNERFVRETEAVRDFLIANATRLTRQRADAEDLVQETLVKAYASFHGYREGTQLKSWLARIMTNAWIDKYRSSQRRPAERLGLDVTEMSSTDERSHVRHGSEARSAESKALQALPSEAELALCRLPDDLREIVYYACIAEYRNTEIAVMLGIPVGTVGSRLHRGKAMLREALAGPDGARGAGVPGAARVHDQLNRTPSSLNRDALRRAC
ncbi:MAG: sigma-70 family RNA polymerase sigma factor [Mycobacterium sp.]